MHGENRARVCMRIAMAVECLKGAADPSKLAKCPDVLYVQSNIHYVFLVIETDEFNSNVDVVLCLNAVLWLSFCLKRRCYGSGTLNYSSSWQIWHISLCSDKIIVLSGFFLLSTTQHGQCLHSAHMFLYRKLNSLSFGTFFSSRLLPREPSCTFGSRCCQSEPTMVTPLCMHVTCTS